MLKTISTAVLLILCSPTQRGWLTLKMLCQCIVAYFSYNMQTPQREFVTDPEKTAFYQIIRPKKKRLTLDKYKNYLFKCPICFRLSDILIVSWQMVDRPNTLFHPQDCFHHRVTILWSVRMYHTCRHMYLLQLSSRRSVLGLEACTCRRYRKN